MADEKKETAPGTTALVRKTPRQFSLLPTTLAEARELSRLIAESEFAPKDYRGKPDSVLIAVQMGADVGLSPMQALQNIAVINGRPSIWGDAALALVLNAGVLARFVETVEGTPGSDEFAAVCTARRNGWPDDTVRRFSIGDAKRANLWQKDKTPWVTYPNRMLQMRARGFTLRDCAPDVLMGLILAEEAMDLPVSPSAVGMDVIATPVDLLEGVDDELAQGIQKGFELLAFTPAQRHTKALEYFGGDLDPSARASQAAKLYTWLKDEYSRRQTGKSVERDANGKSVKAGKPKPTPVDPPAPADGSLAPSAAVSSPSVPNGGASGQPLTASDIFKGAADPELGF